MDDFTDVLKNSLLSAFRVPHRILFGQERDRATSDSTEIMLGVRGNCSLSHINLEAFSGGISIVEASQGLSALASVMGVNASFADPSCFGCQNYHGKTYSGVKLVCAMHPSGWGGEDICPDKKPSDNE